MPSEQQLRKWYKDANKDGKPGLTLEELRAFLKKIDPKVAERCVTDFFGYMDRDKDKLISEQEFVDALKE